MQKKCTRCGEIKMLTEFVKHTSYKDGHYSRCKTCTRELEKTWRINNQDKKRESRAKYRENNRENIREMDRQYYADNHEKRLETARKAQQKYYKTEKGREKYDIQNKVCRKRHPEKAKARSLLSNAICDGKIIRPTKCSLCSSDQFAIEAHHPDYSKPYEVILLCRSCHGIVHRKIKSHRDRLSEKTSKEDATVKTCEETAREIPEEGTPPLKNGQ